MNALTVNQYFLCPELLEKIMSELTDLKTSVAELKKDGARALEALGGARQDLVDIKAKLDAATSSTNLTAEDRAALDDIKTMVSDADKAIEDQVPEAPAPEPAPAS